MARRLLVFPVRMPGNARKIGRHGFTLIELMVVVAIVGVLAVLAVVGYRKLILSSKITEATGVVSSIRIAQEDYKVERGVYADIGKTPCPYSGKPASVSNFVKVQWNPACVGGGTLPDWKALPVHVDGPVQFGYATFTAPGSTKADVMTGGFAAWVDVTALDTTKPWYVIQAMADLDGNGAPYTQVEATSGSNQIFTLNDGQ